MVASRGDGADPEKSDDPHRSDLALLAPVAQLAGTVGSPGPHRAILLQREGVRSACGDRHDTAQRRNPDGTRAPSFRVRIRGVARETIADLPLMVGPPSPNRPIFGQCQRMTGA